MSRADRICAWAAFILTAAAILAIGVWTNRMVETRLEEWREQHEVLGD